MKPHEEESLERLGAALARFQEALALPKNIGVNLDGSIQRFEFTFELTWKCAKRALAANGVQALSPRAAIKECYAQGWISDEAVWLEMLSDRNRTSHTYVEDIANEVYDRLKDYSKAMQSLADAIQQALEKGSEP